MSIVRCIQSPSRSCSGALERVTGHNNGIMILEPGMPELSELVSPFTVA